MQEKKQVDITATNLEEFKKLVRKAIFLKQEEEKVFKAIPDDIWKDIFAVNFDGNFEFARRVLLSHFKEIERIDNKNLDREKNKIHGLEKGTNFILDAYKNKQKVLFVTDFDNDGSLSQAIINEYLAIDKDAQKHCVVEYAQVLSAIGTRGFNLEHIDLICKNQGLNEKDEFLIVTADNGINSVEEQERIQKKYPNSKLVVTDHHNPDKEMVVKENANTVIFNPHYKPTDFFKKYNISGANTIGVLMKNVLTKRLTDLELATYSKNMEKITQLCKVSNLLDYVPTHPADKPEKDFIITKFLHLQPLMNINNSISKIITGEIPIEAITALEKKIPQLNTNLIYEEAKNIHVQNHLAKVLLFIHNKNKTGKSDDIDLNEENFNQMFMQEINNPNHYIDNKNINPNYIEQLRPLIFGLSADYEKNDFLSALTDKMVNVYEVIRKSEQNIAKEIRRGEVITKDRLNNSVIAYADPNILTVFNRKFLNKVYNDENPGFSLTLDSVGKYKVSGSFRSLYNISDILKDKKKLEAKLSVTIETPGHEMAAGFIVKSKKKKDGTLAVINDESIKEINKFIDASIKNIRKNEVKAQKEYLLTDFNSIDVVDRINKTIRGNVSNFNKVNTLIQIDKDTIWTDSYTTKQYTMEEVIKEKKYGYVTVNTNFDGGTIILPVELIRRVVENKFQDYLSLGYMDGGVFMVDRVVKKDDVKNVIDIRMKSKKTVELLKAFEKDFTDKNFIDIPREEIQNNPFFKYNDYSKLNFDLFEKMVIGIIDSNNIDILSVFDVEANGFGNAKLMNIGAMNYSVNEKSGTKMSSDFFFNRFYSTIRGEQYLLETDDINNLKKLSPRELSKLPLDMKKQVIIKYEDYIKGEADFVYYIHKDALKIGEFMKKNKTLPFTKIKNYLELSDKEVIFNREISATMCAYLVNDKDFKVPQEMINLTGINQDALKLYGKSSAKVDEEMTEYYKDKKVLFGAHNTPYDARILRSNLPQMYQILRENGIYDSAIFSKEQKLAYDDVKVSNFNNIDGVSKTIYFYDNAYSDFSLTKFIQDDKNGYFPDRTNKFLLEIDNGEYYLVDKQKHEKTKLAADKERLLESIVRQSIPNVSVKYSVERLSEQWMIHSLLLSDEKFDIKHIDLDNSQFHSLIKHKQALHFFQDNYHFDSSVEKNINNFKQYYAELKTDAEISQFNKFVNEFLLLNKDIQQKFSDAWMYKKVLEIKDPVRTEITNDLVDLVYYQTHIPKDKIKTIFNEAIAFKDKHKVRHVLQHEMHANGPWRTDVKGDIAFEDKLTMLLLANREYNSYNHNIGPAIRYFNEIKIKAQNSFNVAHELSDDLAQDSYSFRQGILYSRDNLTPMIENIQEKEMKIKQDGRQLVKFKLDNDVLPPETCLYALIKEDKRIDRDEIEKHKQMFSFIVLNMQLLNSMKNVGTTQQELVQVLESNLEKMREYKAQLAEVYDFVEFNKKDYQMKKFLEKAKDSILDNGKKGKTPPMDQIDSANIEKLKRLLISLAQEAKFQRPFDGDIDDKIQAFFNDLDMLSSQKTKLERAIQGEGLGFGVTPLTAPTSSSKVADITDYIKSNILEDSFLSNVDINRVNPVDRLIKKHTSYHLIKDFIFEKMENAKYNVQKQNLHKPS